MSDFSVRADGLYYKEEFVSDFYPKVMARQVFISAEDHSTDKEYSVSVCLADGRMLEPHSLHSIHAIPYFEIWPECKDALLTSRQKKLLYSYLQEQAAGLPITEIYCLSRLGLYDKVFLYGRNQMISISGQKLLNYMPSPELPDFPYLKVTREDLTAYAVRLLALKPGVSDILLSIGLLSVLKPLFVQAGYPPNFFVSIYGQSGSMKTTLADLFFVQTLGQKLSFISSTKKDIERALTLYQGHTVVIDDYHPVSSTYDKQKLSSRMDMIARASNDPNQALSVITGEYLDGSFSVQDRMIQISINTPIEDLTELSLLQQKSSTVSSLLYEFAKVIYSRQEETASIIRDWFETMPYSAHNEPVLNYRIVRNIHFLALSFELFRRYFLKSLEVGEKLDNVMKDSLSKLKKQQMIHMNRVRVLEEDSDWLEILYEVLKMDSWNEYNEFQAPSISGLYRIRQDDYVYITSPILKKALKEFFGKPVNVNRLIQALTEEKILKEDSSSAHVIKRDRVYYYAINYLRLSIYYHQIKGN